MKAAAVRSPTMVERMAMDGGMEGARSGGTPRGQGGADNGGYDRHWPRECDPREH